MQTIRNNNKQRNPILDIAKGIGIILVVVGHCLEIHSRVGCFIWSFHMPLFFIISGLCFDEDRHKEICPFVYKRFKTLILPALIFTLIYLIVGYVLRLPNESKCINGLKWEGFPGAMWFLVVLFLTEVLYSITYGLLSDRHKWGGYSLRYYSMYLDVCYLHII